MWHSYRLSSEAGAIGVWSTFTGQQSYTSSNISKFQDGQTPGLKEKHLETASHLWISTTGFPVNCNCTVYLLQIFQFLSLIQNPKMPPYESCILFIQFFIYFYQLEANYFIILQWFLSYIDMNQPWIYMYSPSRSLKVAFQKQGPCDFEFCPKIFI